MGVTPARGDCPCLNQGNKSWQSHAPIWDHTPADGTISVQTDKKLTAVSATVTNFRAEMKPRIADADIAKEMES